MESKVPHEISASSDKWNFVGGVDDGYQQSYQSCLSPITTCKVNAGWQKERGGDGRERDKERRERRDGGRDRGGRERDKSASERS